MNLFEVVSAIVDDKKEQIVQEINIINEGIVYLQLTQESLMESDIISDSIIEKTFDCINNRRSLQLIKAKLLQILPLISNTDEVSDIYSYYGVSRNKWLEEYKKGKA